MSTNLVTTIHDVDPYDIPDSAVSLLDDAARPFDQRAEVALELLEELVGLAGLSDTDQAILCDLLRSGIDLHGDLNDDLPMRRGWSAADRATTFWARRRIMTRLRDAATRLHADSEVIVEIGQVDSA